jgi:2',3'-cyclic-nucleotide 2'-phosphodiesterase (5'-nucleotidase family)
VKIGFVGVVIPDTFTKSVIKDILNEVGEPMYDFLADYTGDRLAERLQQAIDEVRVAGADYVILVSHLGNDDSITPQYRCDAIVGKLTGLDMVIDGHSHELYNRTVTDRAGRQLPIAQANTKLDAIGQLTIYRDGRLEEKLVDSVPEPTGLPFERVTRRKVERCVDPDMKAYLDGVVAAYTPLMERKLGALSRDLIVRDGQVDVSRDAENGLCDLVADAYRAIGGTQTALINAGSVRNNLEAGKVTYNSVLNILPYSNDVVTAKVTGQMLLDALEFGVALLPNISARFPQVSGIAFHVNTEIPTSVVQDSTGQFAGVDGPRRVYDVTVGGVPIDPKAEYTITGTTYLLNGGDGYAMFREADILSSTMLPDNEVVMKYIEENLNGVIPEAYENTQGRICIDGRD